jgi:hypothetical protein
MVICRATGDNMSKAKSVSKSGGDNELTDDELGKVAGGVEGEAAHKDHTNKVRLETWSIDTPVSPTKR